MATISRERHSLLFRDEEPEWMVWLVVFVALIIGLILKGGITGQTKTFRTDNISLAYPATWTKQANEAQLLRAVDTFSSAQAPTSVNVEQLPIADIGRNLTNLSDIALAWSTREGRLKLAHRTLGIESDKLAGRDVMVIETAYVPKRHGLASFSTSIPTVAQERNYLTVRDDIVTIITLSAESDQFQDQEATWRRILASISLP
ncbi:MAG: hypothetical protein AAF629_13560 [Chloroflexota bacterium]